MILSVFSSAAISVCVTLIFIWLDIQKLERKYQEKDRLLDAQLAYLKRAMDSLDETKIEIDSKLGVLYQAIKVIKPFADGIDKIY